MVYKFLDTESEVLELRNVIDEHVGIVGADIETTGLDFMLDKILLLQLNIRGDIYLLDVRKAGTVLLSNILNSLNNPNKLIIFHNGKFDLKFLYYRTNILLKYVYDTFVAEQAMNQGKGTNPYPSLADLAEKYTDYFMDKTVRNEFIDFPDDKPYTESMLQYSALDVIVLPEIHKAQMEEAERTFQTKVVMLEGRVVPVAAKMEADGIKLNVSEWLAVEAKAVERRDELTTNLKNQIIDFAVKLKADHALAMAEMLAIPVKGKARRAGLEAITDLELVRGWLFDNFNVKSPLQMKSVMHLMGIPVKDTNEKTLAEYAGNEFIDLLLQIREVNKQIDSYGRNVVELIHPVTGKIHTEYNTVGTQTGRFSSKNPNMQQVPRHGGYRECFYPDPGYVFAAADYSQQEYRLAGAISRDPVIISAYQQGSDMHTATARILYGKDTVTKDERNRGKTVNFAILYGSTEFGLKHNLDISIEEAVTIINNFWDGYKNLSDFMKFAGKKILELGYSSTPLGRRRYNLAKPLYADSKQIVKWQNRVLREGRNFIIQGGGADMLKIAMVECFDRNPFGDKFRLCLQIHDELIAQVHESIKEEGLKFMMDVMEEVEARFLGEIPALVEGELKDKWSK